MPPTPHLTRKQSQAIDRLAIEEYGLPGVVLMENAGRGAAEWLIELGVDGPVAICCGKGNNGGDGFVIARHLANRGYAVSLLLFSPPDQITGDAAVNLRVVQAMRLPALVVDTPEAWERAKQSLAEADWIVDALLGTGAQGSVREPFGSAIEAIRGAGRRVFAVDLPSGLDCDTGELLGPCVQAEATATFASLKIGFDNPVAKRVLGAVRVIPIGAPAEILGRV